MDKAPKRNLPRYQEVRRELIDEILAGTYAIGASFPTDHELCARFGVSRHTVREALRELQREGLITRQQGFGTTVVATELKRRPYVLSVANIDDIQIEANEMRLDVVFKGLVTLGEDLARPAGRDVGERWLRIAGTRRRADEDEPQCWTETLVAQKFAAIRPEVTGERAIYLVLGDQFGITPHSIQQVISGATIPGKVGDALGVAPDSAGILVRRTYFDGAGEAYEIALTLYPADRFVNETWLHRARGPAAAKRQAAG